jgi:hypothetical protein
MYIIDKAAGITEKIELNSFSKSLKRLFLYYNQAT